MAILLVYTGFKLASPKVFKHIYSQGIEQLIFFVDTLLITLYTDLLLGIFGGLLLALVSHFLLANVSIRTFFKMIFKSESNLFFKKDGSYDLKIKGIANFLATINIDNLISQVPLGTKVKVDLSEARLVDFTILEHLYDFQRMHLNSGGKVEINGLEKHVSSSNHKLAMKLLTSSAQKLTTRQVWQIDIAKEYGWTFQQEPKDAIDYFETFDFFKSRPIEIKSNSITGQDKNIDWEITDVIFEEGAFLSYEEYKTTLGLVKFPFPIPKFTIEKKGFLDKYLHLSEHKDIDYDLYHDFSNKFIVKVQDRGEMKAFLNDNLKAFIEESDMHHLESNGEAILVFNNELRLARISEYWRIIKVTEKLRGLVKGLENAL